MNGQFKIKNLTQKKVSLYIYWSRI